MNTSLQEIFLNNNNLNLDDAIAILHALQTNKHSCLQCIGIEDNKYLINHNSPKHINNQALEICEKIQFILSNNLQNKMRVIA